MADSISNRLLSLNVGESVLFTDAKENSIRCLSQNVKRMWGRKFTVRKTPEGFRVTRIDNAPTLNEVLGLLRDVRTHLPIAAASWNEDENPDVATYHVARVMNLIGKVDALLARSAA